jgi:hypothetical protein
MSVISIDVPEDLVGRIDQKLGRGASKTVARAAFVEWASWLLAESRPLSMSELEIERVHTLYRDIFTNELPTASDLSARLQLPIARCRYIIQSLGYQFPAFLQSRKLAVLQSAYQSIKPNGDLYVMDISPECAPVLDNLLSSLADAAGLAELRGKKRGNVVRYELTSGYYQRLGKAIEDEIDKLSSGAAT